MALSSAAFDASRHHHQYALASHNAIRQYQDMDNSSGVGVLDKAALVLAALEPGPATLAGLVASTGLARPTAHRLAVALEHHRLVARDMQGRFILGPRLGELAAAAGEDRLLAAAGPVLARLRDITGESAQLFRRQGDFRVCVAAADRPTGLRDSIPVGGQLTMSAGSAAQILLSWEDPERMNKGLLKATFSAAELSAVRRRGWAQSVGERETGRRLGVRTGPLPLRQGRRRGVGVRAAGAPDPSARPYARTRRGRRRRAPLAEPPPVELTTRLLRSRSNGTGGARGHFDIGDASIRPPSMSPLPHCLTTVV